MIRRLDESHIEGIIALRREALLADPATYTSAPDTDATLDPVSLRESMGRSHDHGLFGAFAPGLVGMVGVRRYWKAKEAHKALVWGLYVQPAHRRRGLGTALLAAAIGLARSLPGVSHLHLAVSEAAGPAIRLYDRAGFETWGIEPAAIQVGEVSAAVHHMVLPLGGSTG